MSWVVDTCVLVDVFEGDPEFAGASADALDALSPEGLVVSPATFVELAPAFHGDIEGEREFLAALGVETDAAFDDDVLLAAHRAWHRHILRKRAGEAPKRPVADVLIGALAMRRSGLLTRNAGDFRSLFPALRIRVPVGREQGTGGREQGTGGRE